MFTSTGRASPDTYSTLKPSPGRQQGWGDGRVFDQKRAQQARRPVPCKKLGLQYGAVGSASCVARTLFPVREGLFVCFLHHPSRGIVSPDSSGRPFSTSLYVTAFMHHKTANRIRSKSTRPCRLGGEGEPACIFIREVTVGFNWRWAAEGWGVQRGLGMRAGVLGFPGGTALLPSVHVSPSWVSFPSRCGCLCPARHSATQGFGARVDSPDFCLTSMQKTESIPSDNGILSLWR